MKTMKTMKLTKRGTSKSRYQISATETETVSDTIINISQLQPATENKATIKFESITPISHQTIRLFSNNIDWWQDQLTKEARDFWVR